MSRIPTLAFASILCAGPAAAWEFAASPVCTIWHDTGAAEMRVTYDPQQVEPYAVVVTLADAAWPDTTPYAIRFDGVRSFAIGTDRHRLSSDRKTVTARDTGFGNVLAGLSKFDLATPVLGDRSAEVPLRGAAEAVDKFRACTQPGVS